MVLFTILMALNIILMALVYENHITVLEGISTRDKQHGRMFEILESIQDRVNQPCHQ